VITFGRIAFKGDLPLLIDYATTHLDQRFILVKRRGNWDHGSITSENVWIVKNAG
jgi:hypothetical protein